MLCNVSYILPMLSMHHTNGVEARKGNININDRITAIQIRIFCQTPANITSIYVRLFYNYYSLYAEFVVTISAMLSLSVEQQRS